MFHLERSNGGFEFYFEAVTTNPLLGLVTGTVWAKNQEEAKCIFITEAEKVSKSLVLDVVVEYQHPNTNALVELLQREQNITNTRETLVRHG